jgi:hypothetical protein
MKFLLQETDTAKFDLGQTVATPGAVMAADMAKADLGLFLWFHENGKWGDVCAEDAASNDRAVENGSRILSEYHVGSVRFWIITEWDRSVTTILLPSEY